MKRELDAQLIIVVGNPNRFINYKDLLAEKNVNFFHVSTLQEAIQSASENPYSGILIDMPLMIKVADSIKPAVDDLLSGLPSATINISAASRTIKILPRGTIASQCSSVDQFLDVCTAFCPKIIFTRKRKQINFNVLFDTTHDFASPEKTACIDISTGGCFIFSVREDIAEGSILWIKLPDTLFAFPVKCKVCWVRKWGMSQSMPGIGVSFVDTPEVLINAIGALK
jgi:hypothetical protein